MKIKWTDQAENRAYDIAAYIALDSITEAEKWVWQIFDYVRRLERFPESGRYVPELPDRKDIRELVFKNYRIIYKIEKSTVFILTVRNYKQILPVEEIS
ncbi:MAG: type II toxin-antitoxin system RelE/ParE family toxin [Victivallales bacterium]